MSSSVFDASAVLAVLNAEPGKDAAEPQLFGASISSVNYSEVLKKTVEVGGSISKVQLFLAKQNLNIVPFAAQHAVQTAEIWPEAKPLGLSFADRACLSLGLLLELPVLTTDSDMAAVDLPIDVQLVRKKKAA